MAKPENQEMCSCASCPPIVTEVVCNMLAQTAARHNDSSSHASIMAINNQQNAQGMYNAKVQQTLERDGGERLAQAIAQLGAINSRVGGITPTTLPAGTTLTVT